MTTTKMMMTMMMMMIRVRWSYSLGGFRVFFLLCFFSWSCTTRSTGSLARSDRSGRGFTVYLSYLILSTLVGKFPYHLNTTWSSRQQQQPKVKWEKRRAGMIIRKKGRHTNVIYRYRAMVSIDWQGAPPSHACQGTDCLAFWLIK